MSKLLENISLIIRLDAEEQKKIERAFIPASLRKGEHWITAGKVCKQVAFLHSGKLRVYYGDISGDETTCHFFMPESFVSSLTSFLTNTPSTEHITAMEDSELLNISKERLEALSDEIPKLHIWRRVIAENLFISMEKRVAMLQSKTAYERYSKMIEEDPRILLSVPLQYTASFLGITPQHLSRLRRESVK
ncbi:Crp/Fnr family transcriptional regulator [Parapedobacter deserti]|uniref:Crp/Fnr family transcriptional regulator n=1 Tax=Parapedobacter deserti TaxID=1912957 RepID=A0ABV7JEJ3_9SPHI